MYVKVLGVFWKLATNLTSRDIKSARATSTTFYRINSTASRPSQIKLQLCARVKARMITLVEDPVLEQGGVRCVAIERDLLATSATCIVGLSLEARELNGEQSQSSILPSLHIGNVI